MQNTVVGVGVMNYPLTAGDCRFAMSKELPHGIFECCSF